MTTNAVTDAGGSDERQRADDSPQAVADLLRRAAVALLDVATDDTNADALVELDKVRRSLATLFQTVDPATVLAAVDVDRLPDLIDWSGLPEAVATGDYRSAIAYENVPAVFDAPSVLDATDVREGWRQSRELGDAVGRVTDRVTETTVDAESEEQTDDERAVETANDAAEREAGVEVAKSLSTTDSGRRLVVQKSVHDAVTEVRAGILDAHDRIDAAVADVDARVTSVARPTSRNPTAVSTLPRSTVRLGRATAFSTVPTETRYSDAPNFERVYGARFDRRREQ